MVNKESIGIDNDLTKDRNMNTFKTYCKRRKSGARFPDRKANNRLCACHCIAGNGWPSWEQILSPAAKSSFSGNLVDILVVRFISIPASVAGAGADNTVRIASFAIAFVVAQSTSALVSSKNLAKDHACHPENAQYRFHCLKNMFGRRPPSEAGVEPCTLRAVTLKITENARSRNSSFPGAINNFFSSQDAVTHRESAGPRRCSVVHNGNLCGIIEAMQVQDVIVRPPWHSVNLHDVIVRPTGSKG